MPTPVGPVPSDPEDPDLWDFDGAWDGEEWDREVSPTRRWLHVVVVGVVVFGLVLLLLISVL
jgi:hypothetical protein